MTPNLRPYAEMKDSGVEELGVVPAHWEVRKLGQIGRLSKGSGGSKEDEVPTGCPCVRYGDLYTSHRHFIQDSRGFISSEKAKDYTRIRYGDVLFAASGETIDEIGKSAVNLIQGKAYCGGDIILFRANRQADTRFLGYVTDCRPTEIQKARMGRGITVMHIYGDRLKHLSVPLPPVSEQTAIVRFLDHADRRIRRYIHAKERLIALMEEQKQAIIQQAATGRIDVRTGLPYCNYKDSSLEWLPTLPSHWGIRKLGQLSSVFNGATPSRAQSAYWDDGTVPWLNSSKVNDGLVVQPSELVSRKALEECAISLVPRGSVILGLIGQGRTRGMSALLGIDAAINQNLAAIVPSAGINGRYLYRLLTAIYEYVRQIGRGGNQQALNCEIVSGLRVPVPQISEQPAIVEFLEKNVSLVDREIVSIWRQVETMREYRKRLVADVVTGKFDVRGSAGELSGVDFDEHACRLDTDLASETTSDFDDLDVTRAEYEA